MRLPALLIAIALGLAACGPSDGPSQSQVRSDARAADVPILPLNRSVIAALGTSTPGEGFSHVSQVPYSPGVIRAGDVITVRVFETSDDGMFSVEDTSTLDLGEFVVSPDGYVSLPFVGAVRVAGNNATGAQRLITNALRESAVDPQATVSVTVSATDNYTVQGGVASGGTYQLTPRGETILDALASAGGAEGDPNETTITIRRGSDSRTELLSTLLADPSRDATLRPGDAVIVGGGQASFIADGALSSPGEFDFVEGQLTLAQAIARAGGLQDSRANPRAVYIFRRMPVGESFLLEQPPGNDPIRVAGDVIFQADYTSPTGRLDAGQFMLRDGDVLYVGNSPVSEFLKFFQIFERPPEIPAVPGQ
ncbi:polysaccharide biosynthesis/export family protein [Jannaschia sp. CCS1]|uniref:polysaccharide biosynthesis/export family protein n=1 Tax=Jannaschia sp. (strain CCS1) TaxID=290400 RepID=UPI000053ADD7|nr:polysaccharide biosynthesis/export family protein [Jannaschia sp. CCS1]ABD55954.1 polysaccharide export protein [Jannaschia sp. CCS1]